MLITDDLFKKFEKFVPYCYYKLEQTDFVRNNKEDLYQEGYLAILKSIETYEEYRTVCLSSYVFHAVKYAMYHYIRDNIAAYSYNVEFDLNMGEVAYDETYEQSPQEYLQQLLTDYRHYLENYKNKNTKVDLRVSRASIILEEYLQHGKVSTRKIEEEYYINRSTVSEIIKELRKTIILKRENKLYRIGADKDGTNSER